MANAPDHGESAERTILLDYSQRKYVLLILAKLRVDSQVPSVYSAVYTAIKQGDWLVVLAAALVLLTSTLHHLLATVFSVKDVEGNVCGAFIRRFVRQLLLTHMPTCFALKTRVRSGTVIPSTARICLIGLSSVSSLSTSSTSTEDAIAQNTLCSACTVHLLALVLGLFTLGGIVLHVFHRRARKGLILPSNPSTIGAVAYIAAPLGAMFSGSLGHPDEASRVLFGCRFCWDSSRSQVEFFESQLERPRAAPPGLDPQRAAGLPSPA